MAKSTYYSQRVYFKSEAEMDRFRNLALADGVSNFSAWMRDILIAYERLNSIPTNVRPNPIASPTTHNAPLESPQPAGVVAAPPGYIFSSEKGEFISLEEASKELIPSPDKPLTLEDIMSEFGESIKKDSE